MVGVWREDDRWTWFVGCHPVCSHPGGDWRLFRLTVAQLIDAGACRPCEIIRAFGVSKSCVDRAAALYRRRGAEGFSAGRPAKSGAAAGS